MTNGQIKDIVEAIFDELSSRCGLDAALDDIDEETLNELKERIAEIVRDAVDAS